MTSTILSSRSYVRSLPRSEDTYIYKSKKIENPKLWHDSHYLYSWLGLTATGWGLSPRLGVWPTETPKKDVFSFCDSVGFVLAIQKPKKYANILWAPYAAKEKTYMNKGSRACVKCLLIKANTKFSLRIEIWQTHFLSWTFS